LHQIVYKGEIMLKSPIFWSGASVSLVIVAGTLLVPMLTGTLFESGSLFVVVPLAILVGTITSMSLDRVFGVKSSTYPVRKWVVDGYTGMFVGFVFGLLGGIVFLLPF
jgi:hypothetical protein